MKDSLTNSTWEYYYQQRGSTTHWQGHSHVYESLHKHISNGNTTSIMNKIGYSYPEANLHLLFKLFLFGAQAGLTLSCFKKTLSRLTTVHKLFSPYYSLPYTPTRKFLYSGAFPPACSRNNCQSTCFVRRSFWTCILLYSICVQNQYIKLTLHIYEVRIS